MALDLLFWGLSIGIAGKIMLGFSVVNVHAHVIKEKKIDRDVLWAMRRERWIAVIGVALIVSGYFLEVVFYGYVPGI